MIRKVTACLLLVTTVGQAQDLAPAEEHLLGTMKSGAQPWSFCASPDGKHFAYLAKDNRGYRVVIDGVEGNGYSELGGYTPWFSDDSHFMYVAGNRGKFRVVLDGVETGPTFEAKFPVQFAMSPTGGHAAVIGSVGDKKNCVLLDGAAQEISDAIAPVEFSDDGQRLAYVAKFKRKVRLVVDNVPGNEYDAIEEFVFSPGGKHVAYVARQGKKKLVVMDSSAGPLYDEIRTTDFWAPPDKLDALKRGEPVVRGTFLTFPGLKFSRDGETLAYIAREGKKWRVVVGGRAGPELDTIGASGVVLSRDGQQIAYATNRDGKMVVVANGHETLYDGIAALTLIYGLDDKLYVCAAEGKLYYLFVDGQRTLGPYEVCAAGGLFLSPEGRSIIVTEESGNPCVVINGTAFPQPDGLNQFSPRWSPDGKHSVFEAKKATQWLVVVDGRPQEPYALVFLGSNGFCADNSLSYIAFKSENGALKVYRVDMKLD